MTEFPRLVNRIQNVFEALRFGDPRLIPASFGTENQGGGIAVANAGMLNQADVIVFHIDHPADGKDAYYRVGWNADSDGTVADGWTDPIASAAGSAPRRKAAGSLSCWPATSIILPVETPDFIA
jgi:hypothetical protein